MPQSKSSNSFTKVIKESVGTNKNGGGPIRDQSREGIFKFALATGACYGDLQTDTSIHVQYPRDYLRFVLYKHADIGSRRYEFMKKLQSLQHDIDRKQTNACDVSAWPIDTGHKSGSNRIAAGCKNNRNCLGR